MDRGIAFWRRRSRWGKGLIVIGLVFLALIAIGIVAGDPDRETAAMDTETVTVTETAEAETTEETTTKEQIAEPTGPSIVVVTSKSWCAPTGIDDIYTGDGHVTFFLTVRNTGDEAGTINITPVRFYDDGEENRSPLDMVSIDVDPGRTERGRTPAYKYKAHEHEIIDCAVYVDGEDIPVRVNR